jgi:hypothetical protein
LTSACPPAPPVQAVIFDLFNTLTNGQTDPEAAIIARYGLFLPYEAVESLVCGQQIRADGCAGASASAGAGAGAGAGGVTYEEYLRVIMEGLGLPDSEATTYELNSIFEKDCANITIAPVRMHALAKLVHLAVSLA